MRKGPVAPEEFPFLLRCYDSKEHEMVMDPFEERINNQNFYRFYFLHFILDVKVDKRPLQEPLQ